MTITARMVLGLTVITLSTAHLVSAQGFGAALADGGAGLVLVGFEGMLGLIGEQELIEDGLQGGRPGHEGCSSLASRSEPVCPA